MVQFHQRLDGIWFVLARHGGRRDGGQVAHPPVHPQGTYIDIIGSPSVTHTHPHITHLVTPSIPFIPQFLSHPFFNPLFLTPSPTPSTTPSHVISYRIISSPLLSRQVSPRSGGDNNTHTFITHPLTPSIPSFLLPFLPPLPPPLSPQVSPRSGGDNLAYEIRIGIWEKGTLTCPSKNKTKQQNNPMLIQQLSYINPVLSYSIIMSYLILFPFHQASLCVGRTTYPTPPPPGHSSRCSHPPSPR